MSFDAIYSYLIGLTWFFLASWVLLLATAYIIAFNSDWIQKITKDTK
jgi:hypothetical protein